MKNLLTILFPIVISTNLFGYAGWTQKANFPNAARHRAASFSIADKGYVGIGHTNGAGPNVVYSDWWEFDPATNSWTQKADFPVGNYGVSTFVIGNKGYMGGGVIGAGSFYEFKPLTNKWALIAQPPTSPNDETAFALNGKGYVLDDLNLYEYDPQTGTWTTKGNLPQDGWQISSFVIQDKAYLKVGGNFYEYKPATDSWTPRASFPGLASSGSGAFAVNNKGYIVCGYNGALSDVVSEVWEYDPAYDTWTQKPDFPGISRRFCTAFNIGNKGYFGLGTNGTNNNDFWEYNPALQYLDLNEHEGLNFSVYPNPSSDQITIETNTETNYELTIYNSLGQKLIETTIEQKITLFNTDFGPGLFYFQINTDQEKFTGSFIFN
ncbi:MAG: T9SS type A sorting domain-containing protein [Putridiphycobacter sp.]